METNLTIFDMLEFIDKVPPPQADVDFFSSKAWIRKYFSRPDSAYKAVPFFSRFRKPDTNDVYFSKTIASEDTIPHCLLLMRKGTWELPAGGIPDDGKKRPFSNPPVPDVMLVVDLKSGMNGFAHTAHGGAMCALLDETLGMCVEVHRQRLFSSQKTLMYTAGLNVSFLAPVPTPSILIVRAWLLRQEGRKWILRAQVVGEDDRVLMETESIWISVKENSSL